MSMRQSATIPTKSVNYDYYTDAVGTVRDIVFSSKDEYFDSDKGSFEYDFSDFSFEKPEKYISNHEPITIRKVGPQEMTIGAYDSIEYYYYFGKQEQGDGTTIPYLTYLKNRGYNKVDVKIDFFYVQKKSGKWYFYLCPTGNKDINFGKREGGATGPVELFYGDIDIDRLSDYNQICLYFDSIHPLHGFDVVGLVIEFTFHQ